MLIISVNSISNEESTSKSPFSFLGESIGFSVVITTSFSSGTNSIVNDMNRVNRLPLQTSQVNLTF